MVKSSTQGSFHFPFLMFTFLGCMIGFGIWEYQRGWYDLVKRQLNLNCCVGKVALKLKQTLIRVESLNRKIIYFRALIACIIALTKDPFIQKYQTILSGLAFAQDQILQLWKIEKIRWLVHRCGNPRIKVNPLPELRWIRPPADFIGPKPLEWEGDLPSAFWIQTSYFPRKSSAKVWKALENEEDWKAEWALP